jgi:hypothetical protein
MPLQGSHFVSQPNRDSVGDTYYDRGIINAGIQASRFLGQDGEPPPNLTSDQDTGLGSLRTRKLNAFTGECVRRLEAGWSAPNRSIRNTSGPSELGSNTGEDRS